MGHGARGRGRFHNGMNRPTRGGIVSCVEEKDMAACCRVESNGSNRQVWNLVTLQLQWPELVGAGSRGSKMPPVVILGAAVTFTHVTHFNLLNELLQSGSCHTVGHRQINLGTAVIQTHCTVATHAAQALRVHARGQRPRSTPCTFLRAPAMSVGSMAALMSDQQTLAPVQDCEDNS